MKKLLIAIIVIAALGLGWWLGSPLFIDKEINDELPEDIEKALFDAVNPDGEPNVVLPEAPDREESMDEEKMEMIEKLSEQVPEEMKEAFKEQMMEQVQVEVEEPKPEMINQEARGPRVVSTGSFVDVAHRGSGKAHVIDTGDNNILRFEDLAVDNGPDLRVLLSKNANVQRSADLGDYIEVGKVKGNVGNQNYTLDAGVDVSEYKSVIIYCKPFHVVFNSADLN